MARISAAEAGSPNHLAYLDMLAYTELGRDLLEKSDDGYNVIVGSTARTCLTAISTTRASLLRGRNSASSPRQPVATRSFRATTTPIASSSA